MRHQLLQGSMFAGGLLLTACGGSASKFSQETAAIGSFRCFVTSPAF